MRQVLVRKFCEIVEQVDVHFVIGQLVLHHGTDSWSNLRRYSNLGFLFGYLLFISLLIPNLGQLIVLPLEISYLNEVVLELFKVDMCVG